jgi:hypothetical protein
MSDDTEAVPNLGTGASGDVRRPRLTHKDVADEAVQKAAAEAAPKRVAKSDV